ncbi:hypothetical protein AB1N83_014465 [Pleurotus pulmonarius]|nr:hypothetical protein EYR36_011761 [Pleurotus pulmonarius]KAF4607337.1 hypothetical protein EYR38_001405 [Pleurotus pulmonarius]
MAPSLETSYRGHLPVAPSTPVRVVSILLHSAHQRAINDNDSSAPGSSNIFSTPVQEAIGGLCSTSASFLVSSSPVNAASQLSNLFAPVLVSPQKPKYRELLSAIPSTKLEEDLQHALEMLWAKYSQKKVDLISAQSALVLNSAYCDLVQGQLQAQEESHKKAKKGRLVGDGLPRLLSAQDFVTRVADFHQQAQDREKAQKQQKATREDHARELAIWRQLEGERIEENKKVRTRWQELVKAWEEERDAVKREKREIGWKKPLLRDMLFPPIPKPSKNVGADQEDNCSDLDSGSDSGSDSDSSSSDS